MDQCEKKISWAVWIYSIITFMSFSGTPSAWGDEKEDPIARGSVTENSPFILHLLNPPWIKDVRYVESQFCQIGRAGQTEKEFWVDITNRAAIQPSGMFIEQLTALPFEPGKQVRGISDRYFWKVNDAMSGSNIHGQLILSPTQVEEGASKANSGQIVAELCQQQLERLRHFGFPALRVNSFSLLNGSRFEAVTLEGIALEGKILNSIGNRPISLTYRLTNNPTENYSVRYEYNSSDQELPSSFEYAGFRNGLELGKYTNRIEEVHYGLDSEIQHGYSPSMFFTNLASFSHVITWSNGVRYQIIQGGKLSGPLSEKQRAYPENVKLRRAVVIAILSISLIVGGIIILMARNASVVQKPPKG